jgi:hypothetical protein
LKDDFTQGLPAQQREIDEMLTASIKAYREAMEQQDGPTIDDWIASIKAIVKFERVRKRVGFATPGSHREDPELAMKMGLFREILKQAKARVETWGGRLYFVYLPEWLRYAHPSIASKDRAEVLMIVKSLGIPIVDIHPVFQGHGDPLALFPFRISGHYNEEGYRLVAKGVLRAISEVH